MKCARLTLAATSCAVLLGACGGDSTPTPAPTPAAAADETPATTKSLSEYSRGVRDYYGEEVPVGDTGDSEIDIEVEYHQPPSPPEAGVGDTITLTGTNIGVRLEVDVKRIRTTERYTYVDLALVNTGIAVHDAAFRAVALTYEDGSTVEGTTSSAKCASRFAETIRVDVSFKASGCLAFPRTNRATPSTFQLALENVPVTAGGIWDLAD